MKQEFESKVNSISALVIDKNKEFFQKIKKEIKSAKINNINLNYCDSIRDIESEDKLHTRVILINRFFIRSKTFIEIKNIKKSLPHITIIILANKEDEADEENLLQAGAQEYLNREKISAHGLKRAFLHGIFRQEVLTKLDLERNSLLEMKAKEKELIKELKNQSQFKSEFLANMSHEIRTPLNVITGAIDLLNQDPNHEDQQKYLRMLSMTTNSLLSLVNDVLDISKIEAGQLKLDQVAFDFEDFLKAPIEMMQIRTKEKSIEFKAEIEQGIPIYLSGDPDRINQILLNLLNNALKFTENGEIELAVKLISFTKTKVQLQFEVKDTGCGIPEEEIDMIFDSFQQSSNNKKSSQGTGLGLPISKQLVELMGGEIRVESKEGLGSNFIFTLKLDTVTQRAKISEDFGQKSLVIASSFEKNINIISEQLKNEDINILSINNIGSLCELLTSKYIDCIVFDDGFIKNFPDSIQLKVTGTSKIILCEPNKQNEKNRKYQYLSIESQSLRQQIIQGLEKGYRNRANRKLSMILEEMKPLKILLADDTPENRLLVVEFLKKAPFTIESVENGEAAVSQFKNTNFDLILMDLKMPIMDGYHAVKEIREWEQDKGLNQTPIIALTASVLKKEIDRCYRVGCDAHLSKPVKRQDLIYTILQYAE